MSRSMYRRRLDRPRSRRSEMIPGALESSIRERTSEDSCRMMLCMRRTEVDCLSLKIRCEFRFLLVHHHSTDRVFLQQFTSLDFRVEPSEKERVGYYCY